jgi:phosphopantothenoylcysteine synthetase/decarboxylase
MQEQAVSVTMTDNNCHAIHLFTYASATGSRMFRSWTDQANLRVENHVIHLHILRQPKVRQHKLMSVLSLD